MRLDLWLSKNNETRSNFARRVGFSPALITQLCNDEDAWVSRETAGRIFEATAGAVTPNDFLGRAIRSGASEDDQMSQFRVAEAVRAFERGEIVVVIDDDDRENEGDLIMAASLATPEKLAFFVRHTSGIVCAPLTKDHAARLNLSPMVANNDAPLQTAFTVSIDYRHGLTTGISAEERCNTVRALTNHNVGAADFVRPGHIFPLIARDGGVLMRSGHTEAAIDLCRLAGLPQVGILSELVNDDGTVKRGAEVAQFAADHGLQVLSIAELIAYRQRNEKFVRRVEEFDLQTGTGSAHAVVYDTQFDPMHHMAVVWGDIRDGREVPVRLHLENVADDVFARNKSLARITDRFNETGRGVIVYLRDGSVGVTGSSMRPREAGVTVPGQVTPASLAEAENEAHSSSAKRAENWREIGLGAQILKDLGISTIKLISSKPRRYVGLEGFGIEIASTQSID